MPLRFYAVIGPSCLYDTNKYAYENGCFAHKIKAVQKISLFFYSKEASIRIEFKIKDCDNKINKCLITGIIA